MLVIFRTDANPRIGTGHAMRCLTLATTLAANGARCIFLCRETGLGILAQRIHAAGHELCQLPEGPFQAPDNLSPPYANWLPHGWEQDAKFCLEALATYPQADWMVVDHYALDIRWERALRPAARNMMVIDDLADREHDCDLLLDQGNHPAAADRYSKRVPATCACLLGPRYALLRPEFARVRPACLQRPIVQSARRLLVMFGGADQEDLTGRAVEAIARSGLTVHVDVVVGPLYSQREDLEKRLAALPSATLHVMPDEIAGLMATADLAIGSPGTTSWERCTLGLPSIAISVAENQEPLAEQLGLRGAHLYLGHHGTLEDADLAAAIRLLAGNPSWRQAMRRQAMDIADGLGASRVARRLAGTAITLRRAEMGDAYLLHQWRNDPRVRCHAFDTSLIPWKNHLAWFTNVLADPDRILLIAGANGLDAGCVRFDLQDGHTRVSIYLDPERLGEGLSVPILLAADAWLATEHPDIPVVVAEVMAGNEASQRAFLGAGYRLQHSVFVKTPGAAIVAAPQP